MALRVFDLLASAVTVSESPDRYFRTQTDFEKLKFLAIDAISRKMIQVPFAAEQRRIAQMMTAERRLPPFADPL